MEKFQQHRQEANSKIKIADHLFTQTYNMLKDPKLLLSITKNIHDAQIHGVNSLLEYEKLFQRAKNPDNTALKLAEFKKYGEKKELNEFVKIVIDTAQMLQLKKDAPIEFAKQDSIILCDKEYNVQKITEESVKENITKTKQMLEKIKKITSKNEEIFKNA